jgi:hypothetical protein
MSYSRCIGMPQAAPMGRGEILASYARGSYHHRQSYESTGRRQLRGQEPGKTAQMAGLPAGADTTSFT